MTNPLEFEKGMDNYDVNIGQIFVKLADFMKAYTTYCANQDNMYATIARLRVEDLKFSQFMEKAERNSAGVIVELPQYLLMPTQRICRYPLLIKELVKQTPQDHPDFTALGVAGNVAVTGR